MNEYIQRCTALVVLIVAGVSLFFPVAGIWVQTSWINYLLMIVMFGMGLTMKVGDFVSVFTSPKEVVIGFVGQFAFMPLLAYLIGTFFGFGPELMAGLVLVGTCPGGTASDVMTYLAKGDVALSVSITAVNTLLAPILTPLLTLAYLGTTMNVDAFGMFLSIVQVVIVPILLGLLIGKLLGNRAATVSKGMPTVSLVAICLIIMAVVSHNAQQIFATGISILAACILLNLLGYAVGYLLATIARSSLARKKALSLEIGMQNSGLATTLAATAFPNMALATVPGAMFSVWHNISGALLTSIFRRMVDSDSD